MILPQSLPSRGSPLPGRRPAHPCPGRARSKALWRCPLQNQGSLSCLPPRGARPPEATGTRVDAASLPQPVPPSAGGPFGGWGMQPGQAVGFESRPQDPYHPHPLSKYDPVDNSLPYWDSKIAPDRDGVYLPPPFDPNNGLVQSTNPDKNYRQSPSPFVASRDHDGDPKGYAPAHHRQSVPHGVQKNR